MATYYAVNPYEVVQLQAQFLAEIGAHGDTEHWLALMDTAFDHGNQAVRWPLPVWPAYHQGKFASMQSLSPTLLELPPRTDAEFESALAHLLAHCNGRPMLSFLKTPLSPQVLRESWQKILKIRTEDQQLFILRFADTRTTPGIAAVLTEAWARLSHGVDQWHYIDREGRLQNLPVAAPGKPASQTGSLQETICIDDKALARLLKHGQADAVASALEEHFPELLMPQSQGAQMYRQLNATCALAEKHGIEAFPDVVALAVSVALSEGDLLKDAGFEHWLAQRQWEPHGMAKALADHFEPEEAPQ